VKAPGATDAQAGEPFKFDQMIKRALANLKLVLKLGAGQQLLSRYIAVMDEVTQGGLLILKNG
jgi:hypothetical protein